MSASNFAYAKDAKSFPNISGNTLFLYKADHVLSSQQSGVEANSSYLYVESNLSLNFDKNWSVKTNLRLQPNNVITTRDSQHPERYRTFLQQDGRAILPQDMGLLVEELKLNFENEDLKFFAGKFDPKFGVAHNKAKRIGIFTAEFTEDYNLREKLGGGISALLEHSKITVNTFFNDTTNLSGSAFNDRGRAKKSTNPAGGTSTPTSYSISMEGEDLFAVDNLFYNLGYRSLGVDGSVAGKREQGYVFSMEYLHKLGYDSSLIPFFEVVKINNFSGQAGRNAVYTTAALMYKYSSWNASISNLTRGIKQNQADGSASGRQMQLSLGYKFTNNIALDITRSKIREDGKSGSLLGAMLSYVHSF